MTVISEHFATANNYIRWSREALNEFEKSIISFADADNFACIEEIDAKTGENVVKYRANIPIPDDFGRKGTEIITLIKHAFDSMIDGCHASLGHEAPRDAYFPWSEGPSDYEGRITAIDKKSKVSVYAKDLWPTLRGLQPYPRGQGYAGGDDIVRELAKIANRKHTIGFSFGVNVTSMRYPDFEIIGSSVVMPAPVWDSVKNEVVVLRYIGNAKVKNYGHFDFYVAMNETGPLKRIPAISALRHFTEYADSVRQILENGVSATIVSRTP